MNQIYAFIVIYRCFDRVIDDIYPYDYVTSNKERYFMNYCNKNMSNNSFYIQFK